MILAVLVALLWLAACVVWAVMSLPGGLMANAFGSFSPRAQMWMLAGLAIGQLTVAASGVPLGLAIAWDESRSSLLWTFGRLLAGGVALQPDLWVPRNRPCPVHGKIPPFTPPAAPSASDPLRSRRR